MKTPPSHIRRWLRIYLIGVTVVSLATFWLIYREIDSMLVNWGMAIPPETAADVIAALSRNAADLRRDLLLLFSAGFLVMVAGGLLWLHYSARHLDRPIKVIKEAIFKLSHGKLNETVAIDSSDEFAEIGANFNELAANLQELLLYIWKQTGRCLELIKELNGPQTGSGISPAGKGAGDPRMENLISAVQDLRAIAKAYAFYEVRLEGSRALAVNTPGQAAAVKSADVE